MVLSTVIATLLLQTIPANTTFIVAADHDGVDTSSYRLTVNGVSKVERPRSELTNGVIMMQVVGGLPAGSYMLEMWAVNSNESAKSLPLTLTTTGGSSEPQPEPSKPPPAPTGLLITVGPPPAPFPAVEPAILTPLSDPVFSVREAQSVARISTTVPERGAVVLVTIWQTGGGSQNYTARDDQGNIYEMNVAADGARAIAVAVSPRINVAGPLAITVNASGADSFRVRTQIVRANGIELAPPVVGVIGAEGLLTSCVGEGFTPSRFGIGICAAGSTGSTTPVLFGEGTTILAGSSQAWFQRTARDRELFVLQFTRPDCGACRSLASTVIVW